MNGNKSFLFIALQLFMILGTIQAVTRVYLCNRTSQALGLNYAQLGASLPSDKWTHGGSLSAPGSEVEVLSFDRSLGIKDDALYEFHVNVFFDVALAPIVLRQRLQGTLVSSNLSHSASGGSFTHQWFNDRELHEQMFKIGNDTYRLIYYAKAALTNDDLYYIIEPVVASEPLVLAAQ